MFAHIIPLPIGNSIARGNHWGLAVAGFPCFPMPSFPSQKPGFGDSDNGDSDHINTLVSSGSGGLDGAWIELKVRKEVLWLEGRKRRKQLKKLQEFEHSKSSKELGVVPLHEACIGSNHHHHHHGLF